MEKVLVTTQKTKYFIPWEEAAERVNRVCEALTGKKRKLKITYSVQYNKWQVEIAEGDSFSPEEVADITRELIPLLVPYSTSTPPDNVDHLDILRSAALLGNSLGVVLRGHKVDTAGIMFDEAISIGSLAKRLQDKLHYTPKRNGKITKKFLHFKAGTPAVTIESYIDEMLAESPVADNAQKRFVSWREVETRVAAAVKCITGKDRTFEAQIYQHDMNNKGYRLTITKGESLSADELRLMLERVGIEIDAYTADMLDCITSDGVQSINNDLCDGLLDISFGAHLYGRTVYINGLCFSINDLNDAG